MMNKITLSKEQILYYAKLAFAKIGCPEIISINLVVPIEYNPMYDIIFSSTYHGEKVKILKKINLDTLLSLVKMGMSEDGYYVLEVSPFISEQYVSIVAEARKKKNSGLKLTKRK